MKAIVILLLAFVMTACTSSRGFDRGYLKTQITDQKVITDEDIKTVLELKPQLPMPYKLAIYFASPKSALRYGSSWVWLGEDKDKLLEIAPELKSKNIISDMFVINDAILEGSDRKAIRFAAARAGADAVLIVQGVSDIDRYNNPLGYTYALLITPLFVPGTEADGIFMVNANMWDVRNEYLYMSAEAEGKAKQTRPAVFIDENQIIKTAKADAMPELKKELYTHLIRMGTKESNNP